MQTRTVPIGSSSIAEAAIVVRRGGLVVYPTDTVYGIGCDPFDELAVERLFEAKVRGSKPIPILCDSMRSARALVSMGPTAQVLAEEFWPGALTIVLPLTKTMPRLIDQGTGEVGVRVPAHAGCVKLIEQCGGFLTGTSANSSGEPPCRTAAQALKALGGRVDLILDGGEVEGEESTVVRVAGDTVEVIREGKVRVKGRRRRGA
jgi:L-threonylcarbamoyladenylate synthase